MINPETLRTTAKILEAIHKPKCPLRLSESPDPESTGMVIAVIGQPPSWELSGLVALVKVPIRSECSTPLDLARFIEAAIPPEEWTKLEKWDGHG